MAIESVKMGRIPKRLKEKALRDYQKQLTNPSPSWPRAEPTVRSDILASIDEAHDDTTSLVQGNYAPMNFDQNVVIVPRGTRSLNVFIVAFHSSRVEIMHSPPQTLRTVDLIELTIAASTSAVDHLNNGVSSLRLPSVFHESSDHTNLKAPEAKTVHLPLLARPTAT